MNDSGRLLLLVFDGSVIFVIANILSIWGVLLFLIKQCLEEYSKSYLYSFVLLIFGALCLFSSFKKLFLCFSQCKHIVIITRCVRKSLNCFLFEFTSSPLESDWLSFSEVLYSNGNLLLWLVASHFSSYNNFDGKILCQDPCCSVALPVLLYK